MEMFIFGSLGLGLAQKMAGLLNLPRVASIQMTTYRYRNVQHKNQIKVYVLLHEW